VRSRPAGSWFSRHHRWAPAQQWWPDGIPEVPETEARVRLVLANDTDAHDVAEPSAALLPALDPTPMGWKDRDWFLGPHRGPLFDRFGTLRGGSVVEPKAHA